MHRDRNLTIGEALVTIVAKVERKGDKYIMNYRYYFKDIYELAYHYEISHDTVSTPLHAAHEDGIAQEYLLSIQLILLILKAITSPRKIWSTSATSTAMARLIPLTRHMPLLNIQNQLPNNCFNKASVFTNYLNSPPI